MKKSDLAANAEKYREEILEYCQSKSTKAPALKFTESRDKFIFALLLHVPIRLNSLHLIERNWIKDGVIYLPADAVKNRKEINIDLPALVLRKLNDYLALRTDNNQKLLVSYQGHPILKKSLYRTVYRRTEKAAGVRLGPHAFRSIVATWASKLIGSEFAADILVISPSVLRKHYYMSDETDKLRNALAKLRGV
ncbi:MAG: hypothetical protein EOP07_24025 [Proteobacteria bacterium]|nr:MAG: hypothetical protein EOP07_24025 [Pseudomonadota bacterium]